MAPKTRAQGPTTPERDLPRLLPRSTRTRTRFFDAFDQEYPSRSLAAIGHDFGIDQTTAGRWVRKRAEFGSPAFRRTRKLSTRLGRPSTVSKETCEMLVSPSRNPVRNQSYEAQIAYHNLSIKKRALQHTLRKYTKGAQRYRMQYRKKKISPVNLQKRVTYGQEHQDKTVDDFWQYVFFTDEAHIDPSETSQGFILREQGTRDDPDNIQERGDKAGVKLHIAAWINWHGKSDRLEFYHDEEERTERPKRPPKPRKSKYESNEQYQARIEEWEASLPHEVIVKPKGNSITQKYYTERLLPVYSEAINRYRIWRDGSWILQEDNDPSHGHRKVGLAQHFREANWIETIIHPPQSPDLNPIEAIWSIIKQRVRKRVWNTTEELKEALQEEWANITMEEIRSRIAEMPWRCKQLIEHGGKPLHHNGW